MEIRPGKTGYGRTGERRRRRRPAGGRTGRAATSGGRRASTDSRRRATEASGAAMPDDDHPEPRSHAPLRAPRGTGHERPATRRFRDSGTRRLRSEGAQELEGSGTQGLRGSGTARGRTATALTLARRGTGAGGVEPRGEELGRGHVPETASTPTPGQPCRAPLTLTPDHPPTPAMTCPFTVFRHSRNGRNPWPDFTPPQRTRHAPPHPGPTGTRGTGPEAEPRQQRRTTPLQPAKITPAGA